MNYNVQELFADLYSLLITIDVIERLFIKASISKDSYESITANLAHEVRNIHHQIKKYDTQFTWCTFIERYQVFCWLS